MDRLTGWDFSLERHRRAAKDYNEEVKPKLIIGSPECKMFSCLQNLSKDSWTSERQKRMDEAIKHIEFVAELYEAQAQAGRWFLHEHPAQATS